MYRNTEVMGWGGGARLQFQVQIRIRIRCCNWMCLLSLGLDRTSSKRDALTVTPQT